MKKLSCTVNFNNIKQNFDVPRKKKQHKFINAKNKKM